LLRAQQYEGTAFNLKGFHMPGTNVAVVDRNSLSPGAARIHTVLTHPEEAQKIIGLLRDGKVAEIIPMVNEEKNPTAIAMLGLFEGVRELGAIAMNRQDGLDIPDRLAAFVGTEKAVADLIESRIKLYQAQFVQGGQVAPVTAITDAMVHSTSWNELTHTFNDVLGYKLDEVDEEYSSNIGELAGAGRGAILFSLSRMAEYALSASSSSNNYYNLYAKALDAVYETAREGGKLAQGAEKIEVASMDGISARSAGLVRQIDALMALEQKSPGVLSTLSQKAYTQAFGDKTWLNKQIQNAPTLGAPAQAAIPVPGVRGNLEGLKTHLGGRPLMFTLYKPAELFQSAEMTKAFFGALKTLSDKGIQTSLIVGGPEFMRMTPNQQKVLFDWARSAKVSQFGFYAEFTELLAQSPAGAVTTAEKYYGGLMAALKSQDLSGLAPFFADDTEPHILQGFNGDMSGYVKLTQAIQSAITWGDLKGSEKMPLVLFQPAWMKNGAVGQDDSGKPLYTVKGLKEIPGSIVAAMSYRTRGDAMFDFSGPVRSRGPHMLGGETDPAQPQPLSFAGREDTVVPELGIAVKAASPDPNFRGAFIHLAGDPRVAVQTLQRMLVPSAATAPAVQPGSSAQPATPAAQPASRQFAPLTTDFINRGGVAATLPDGQTGQPRVVYHGQSVEGTRVFGFAFQRDAQGNQSVSRSIVPFLQTEGTMEITSAGAKIVGSVVHEMVYDKTGQIVPGARIVQQYPMPIGQAAGSPLMIPEGVSEVKLQGSSWLISIPTDPIAGQAAMGPARRILVEMTLKLDPKGNIVPNSEIFTLAGDPKTQLFPNTDVKGRIFGFSPLGQVGRYEDVFSVAQPVVGTDGKPQTIEIDGRKVPVLDLQGGQNVRIQGGSEIRENGARRLLPGSRAFQRGADGGYTTEVTDLGERIPDAQGNLSEVFLQKNQLQDGRFALQGGKLDLASAEGKLGSEVKFTSRQEAQVITIVEVSGGKVVRTETLLMDAQNRPITGDAGQLFTYSGLDKKALGSRVGENALYQQNYPMVSGPAMENGKPVKTPDGKVQVYDTAKQLISTLGEVTRRADGTLALKDTRSFATTDAGVLSQSAKELGPLPVKGEFQVAFAPEGLVKPQSDPIAIRGVVDLAQVGDIKSRGEVPLTVQSQQKVIALYESKPDGTVSSRVINADTQKELLIRADAGTQRIYGFQAGTRAMVAEKMLVLMPDGSVRPATVVQIGIVESAQNGKLELRNPRYYLTEQKGSKLMIEADLGFPGQKLVPDGEKGIYLVAPQDLLWGAPQTLAPFHGKAVIGSTIPGADGNAPLGQPFEVKGGSRQDVTMVVTVGNGKMGSVMTVDATTQRAKDFAFPPGDRTLYGAEAGQQALEAFKPRVMDLGADGKADVTPDRVWAVQAGVVQNVVNKAGTITGLEISDKEDYYYQLGDQDYKTVKFLGKDPGMGRVVAGTDSIQILLVTDRAMESTTPVSYTFTGNFVRGASLQQEGGAIRLQMGTERVNVSQVVTAFSNEEGQRSLLSDMTLPGPDGKGIGAVVLGLPDGRVYTVAKDDTAVLGVNGVRVKVTESGVVTRELVTYLYEGKVAAAPDNWKLSKLVMLVVDPDSRVYEAKGSRIQPSDLKARDLAAFREGDSQVLFLHKDDLAKIQAGSFLTDPKKQSSGLGTLGTDPKNQMVIEFPTAIGKDTTAEALEGAKEYHTRDVYGIFPERHQSGQRPVSEGVVFSSWPAEEAQLVPIGVILHSDLKNPETGKDQVFYKLDEKLPLVAAQRLSTRVEPTRFNPTITQDPKSGLLRVQLEYGVEKSDPAGMREIKPAPKGGQPEKLFPVPGQPKGRPASKPMPVGDRVPMGNKQSMVTPSTGERQGGGIPRQLLPLVAAMFGAMPEESVPQGETIIRGEIKGNATAFVKKDGSTLEVTVKPGGKAQADGHSFIDPSHVKVEVGPNGKLEIKSTGKVEQKILDSNVTIRVNGEVRFEGKLEDIINKTIDITVKEGQTLGVELQGEGKIFEVPAVQAAEPLTPEQLGGKVESQVRQLQTLNQEAAAQSKKVDELQAAMGPAREGMKGIEETLMGKPKAKPDDVDPGKVMSQAMDAVLRADKELSGLKAKGENLAARLGRIAEAVKAHPEKFGDYQKELADLSKAASTFLAEYKTALEGLGTEVKKFTSAQGPGSLRSFRVELKAFLNDLKVELKDGLKAGQQRDLRNVEELFHRAEKALVGLDRLFEDKFTAAGAQTARQVYKDYLSIQANRGLIEAKTGGSPEVRGWIQERLGGVELNEETALIQEFFTELREMPKNENGTLDTEAFLKKADGLVDKLESAAATLGESMTPERIKQIEAKLSSDKSNLPESIRFVRKAYEGLAGLLKDQPKLSPENAATLLTAKEMELNHALAMHLLISGFEKVPGGDQIKKLFTWQMQAARIGAMDIRLGGSGEPPTFENKDLDKVFKVMVQMGRDMGELSLEDFAAKKDDWNGQLKQAVEALEHFAADPKAVEAVEKELQEAADTIGIPSAEKVKGIADSLEGALKKARDEGSKKLPLFQQAQRTVQDVRKEMVQLVEMVRSKYGEQVAQAFGDYLAAEQGMGRLQSYLNNGALEGRALQQKLPEGPLALAGAAAAKVNSELAKPQTDEQLVGLLNELKSARAKLEEFTANPEAVQAVRDQIAPFAGVFRAQRAAVAALELKVAALTPEQQQMLAKYLSHPLVLQAQTSVQKVAEILPGADSFWKTAESVERSLTEIVSMPGMSGQKPKVMALEAFDRVPELQGFRTTLQGQEGQKGQLAQVRENAAELQKALESKDPGRIATAEAALDSSVKNLNVTIDRMVKWLESPAQAGSKTTWGQVLTQQVKDLSPELQEMEMDSLKFRHDLYDEYRTTGTIDTAKANARYDVLINRYHAWKGNYVKTELAAFGRLQQEIGGSLHAVESGYNSILLSAGLLDEAIGFRLVQKAQSNLMEQFRKQAPEAAAFFQAARGVLGALDSLNRVATAVYVQRANELFPAMPTGPPVVNRALENVLNDLGPKFGKWLG
ncbi:MAG: hypothetical protein Q7J69_00665, partial [Candidatus Omnitrophota bacterium]|nr:hypothetical protein [Candidatus Omnitrophota bacterium]